jgi:hypothetical protein
MNDEIRRDISPIRDANNRRDNYNVGNIRIEGMSTIGGPRQQQKRQQQ